ncbi:hypothetical protein AGMMS50256_27810 [Betaproteobacteria bacterium]|nr:hypothetical protein AGMMS50256_27810 [Betaproteobacteria bacterium]
MRVGRDFRVRRVAAVSEKPPYPRKWLLSAPMYQYDEEKITAICIKNGKLN